MFGLRKRCDEGRINGLFKKAYRWGLTTKLFKFEEMVDVADKRLFRTIKISDHGLNHLLPGKRNVYASKLRNRGHQFILPVMHTEMNKQVLLIEVYKHVLEFSVISFTLLFEICVFAGYCCLFLRLCVQPRSYDFYVRLCFDSVYLCKLF